VPIPDIAIKVMMHATVGDATEKIHAAIDYVFSLPLDK
jgi:hypothetical protein